MNNQPNTLPSEKNQRDYVVGRDADVQVIRTYTWVTRVLDRYGKLPIPKLDPMHQLLEPFSCWTK